MQHMNESSLSAYLRVGVLWTFLKVHFYFIIKKGENLDIRSGTSCAQYLHKPMTMTMSHSEWMRHRPKPKDLRLKCLGKSRAERAE